MGSISINSCTFIFSYYTIKFFNFYGKETLFGEINSITVILGGFTSCLLAGALSDKFENFNYRTKSYVASTMCLIAVPFCLALFLLNQNFYLSICLLFLY